MLERLLKQDHLYSDDEIRTIKSQLRVVKEEMAKAESAEEKEDLNQELGRDEKDFAILCANCHRMIHRYGCPSLEEFREKILIAYKDFLKKN